MKTTAISTCMRCGTCCRKGGPALHEQDRALVEQGRIALKNLFTVRQGEPAYDNVTGVIGPAGTDIIKISGGPDHERACVFLDARNSQCTIYDNRPIECRVLQCWDSQRLVQMYNQGRLTRGDLLSKVDGLWELIREHQKRCDYSRIALLAQRIRRERDLKASQAELLEMMRYDQSLREETLTRTGYDDRMPAFLFGRPLVETIRMFRLHLIRTDHGILLEPFI